MGTKGYRSPHWFREFLTDRIERAERILLLAKEFIRKILPGRVNFEFWVCSGDLGMSKEDWVMI